MREKLRLYVCGRPGCPVIGKGPGAMCPGHNLQLIPMVYRIDRGAPPGVFEGLRSQLKGDDRDLFDRLTGFGRTDPD